MKTLTNGVLLVVSFLTAGCGGGGGSAPPAGQSSGLTPAGLWTGTTNTNRDLGCLVLSNNAIFCIYSAVGDPALIDGVVEGAGTVNGNTFAANNARDFSIESDFVFSGAESTLSGTFTPRETFNGSVGSAGVTFNMLYDVQFENSPDLSRVAGEFDGSAAAVPGNGGATAAVGVASDGAFAFVSGATNDCEASGALSPRTDGNVFNAGVTFATGCLYAGETFNGVAFYDTVSTELTVIVVNDARTAASIFIGLKQ